MKISYKLIVVLAVLSLGLAIATLYLDSFEAETIQSNTSHQFQVGVTVRPKNPNPPTAFQKFQMAVSKWFAN